MIRSEQNTFMFSRDIGIEQNWTCKHKVVHSDIILLFFWFFLFFFLFLFCFVFLNFEYKGSTYVSVRFITNYI